MMIGRSSRPRIRMMAGALALLLVVVLSATGTSVIFYFGATQQENEELNSAIGGGLDIPGQQAALERLIAAHPENRAARLWKAGSDVQIGNIREAKEQLEFLEMHFRSFPGITETRLNLLQAAGDEEGLRHMYQEILAGRRQDVESQRKEYPSVAEAELHRYRAAALESEGKLQEAEGVLKKAASESDSISSYYSFQLGEFYIRHEQYDKARDALFQATLERKAGECLWTMARNDMSLAIWLSGNLKGALESYKETAEKTFQGEHWSVDSSVFPTVNGIITLTRYVGKDEDRKLIRQLLEKMQASYGSREVYCEGLPIMVSMRKVSFDEAAGLLKKVRKEAPRLEWALWSATHLTLSGAGDAKELLAIIPPGSVQARAIRAIRDRIPATMPAATQPASEQ